MSYDGQEFWSPVTQLDYYKLALQIIIWFYEYSYLQVQLVTVLVGIKPKINKLQLNYIILYIIIY